MSRLRNNENGKQAVEAVTSASPSAKLKYIRSQHSSPERAVLELSESIKKSLKHKHSSRSLDFEKDYKLLPQSQQSFSTKLSKKVELVGFEETNQSISSSKPKEIGCANLFSVPTKAIEASIKSRKSKNEK